MYRHQLWGGGQAGKELCDLLVVFGNHVIIFSDKYCKFPTTGDLERNWCRWFKKAVWKSAHQVWGAERWLREHPGRLYLDPSCTKPFPMPLPEAAACRIHRVVVAHGSGAACRAALGGSGSLMVMPEIVGDRHFDPSQGRVIPFAVGLLDSAKGYIHVVDDFTLDVLLQTLDTAPDFVQYLERKELFLRSGPPSSAAGEEELLAYYLQHVDGAHEHDFTFRENWDGIWIAEGLWAAFCGHPDRIAQLEEDKISYAWDRLIEHFTSHVLAGTAYVRTSATQQELERGLRFLAAENRTLRRMLAKALLGTLARGQEADRFARVVRSTAPGEPCYVFLTLKPPTFCSYDEYRQVRRGLLETYCLVAKLRFPDETDIVGIAMEPRGCQGGSEDLAYFDGRTWNEQLEQEARESGDKLGLLVDLKPYSVHVEEYPRQQVREMNKGRNRNAPCGCGSGRKYKKCCGAVKKHSESGKADAVDP